MKTNILFFTRQFCSNKRVICVLQLIEKISGKMSFKKNLRTLNSTHRILINVLCKYFQTRVGVHLLEDIEYNVTNYRPIFTALHLKLRCCYSWKYCQTLVTLVLVLFWQPVQNTHSKIKTQKKVLYFICYKTTISMYKCPILLFLWLQFRTLRRYINSITTAILLPCMPPLPLNIILTTGENIRVYIGFFSLRWQAV